MSTLEATDPSPAAASFAPDMSWTRDIPRKKTLDCVALANEVFTQADRKLSQVERTGVDREQIRVAAFMPRLPGIEIDRGCRRYASYMGKKFRQHGLDFRVEEATSADALELLLMGAQVHDKIYGTFVFFPTPFGKTEDYFLRRVRPEKDIEGLTVENTGRMALNIKTVDEEEKYEGVVPCTARAILTLLHQHDAIKNMFPRDIGQTRAHGRDLQQFSAYRHSAAKHADADRRDGHHGPPADPRRGPAAPARRPLTSWSLRFQRSRRKTWCATSSRVRWSSIAPPTEICTRTWLRNASYISTHDNHLGQITTALALYNTALCALWQCHINA